MAPTSAPPHALAIALTLAMIFLWSVTADRASAKSLPREDVIDVPAVGEGLCLHNLFQSNMVLQRDKPIRVWGWARDGENVAVTFAGKSVNAVAGKDRLWKVELPAMPANAKPQKLTVKGKDKTLTLENVLIGDVWLLGGQSNMEFPVANVENGALEIVSANFPQIRILTVPAQDGPDTARGFPRLHEWSGWFSRHFRKGDWEACSPETVRELSAIGYVFARRIHMATQVPIGVVDVSRGGTTVETWTPRAVIGKIEAPPVKALLAQWQEKINAWDAKQDLENRVKRHHQWVANQKKQGKPIPKDRTVPTDLRPGPVADQNRPGNCYASMIAPIAGLSVKGAIFHQGYNNCFNGTEGARMYAAVFPEMITAWRAAFNDPAMPFGILSLCTAGQAQDRDNFTELMADAGPFIREAQWKTFLKFHDAGDKHVGFVSTYDMRRRWYHPQLKVPAGERIARWALATQYGHDRMVKWKPPLIKEMSVKDGAITLKFDQAVGAVDDGSPIEGFAIAGEARRFHPATAEYLVIGKDNRGRDRKDMTTLVLRSTMVPKPTQFRYAWARSPMGNLQTRHNTDVPLATQRSDDWSLESVPMGVQGEDASGKFDRRKVMQALKREDLLRRMAEAKAFIEKHKAELEKSKP